MAYDISNLAANRGGATIETVTSGEKPEAGLYRHPQSGAEIGTLSDPLFGNAQSEAVVRLGFVRVSDLPEGYAKEINIQEGLDLKNAPAGAVATSGDLKGIQARLDALEADKANLQAENDDLKAAAAKAEADKTTLAKGETGPKETAQNENPENEKTNTEGA